MQNNNKDIPVAILAGGQGTRLSPLTDNLPKALVEVGGKPVIEHVMDLYRGAGFERFVIALGHLGDKLRTHFASRPGYHTELVDTGQGTASAGRLRRLAPQLGDGTFMLTWCDGLSDLDVTRLLRFHLAHGRLATVTTVHPWSQFGHLTLEGDQVVSFAEKPMLWDQWINGAFFVLQPEVMELIDGDNVMWEREPMQRLVAQQQLMAYRHDGFWSCMDTLADRARLETLVSDGAPWIKGKMNG